MARFEYMSREACVCGIGLAAGARAVVRDLSWGPIRFVRCETCGSWCQSPQITPRSSAAWYDSEEYQGSIARRGSGYVNYLADEALRLAEARGRLARDMAPCLPARSARVLEIGCATGSVLAVLREAGHEVHGIDLSAAFAAAARQLHGLDVRVSDIASAPFEEDGFDLILMFGTVSNLTALPCALERVRRLLRPEGSVLLNYPDAAALVPRLYGTSFWMFAPSVNTFLTTAGLGQALRNAGLEELWHRTDRQRPSLGKLFNQARCGWALPLLDRLGLQSAPLPLSLPIPGVKLLRARVARGGG